VETPSESPTTAPLPVSAPEPTSDSETGRPGTGLPNASAARTRTAGVIAAPAATFVGCWTNDSAEAAAGDTVNGTLVSAASAPLAAVSCLPPLRSTRRVENVTTPLAPVALAPPPVSVPVPTSARVTDAPATPLPNPSTTF